MVALTTYHLYRFCPEIKDTLLIVNRNGHSYKTIINRCEKYQVHTVLRIYFDIKIDKHAKL